MKAICARAFDFAAVARIALEAALGPNGCTDVGSEVVKIHWFSHFVTHAVTCKRLEHLNPCKFLCRVVLSHIAARATTIATIHALSRPASWLVDLARTTQALLAGMPH